MHSLNTSTSSRMTRLAGMVFTAMACMVSVPVVNSQENPSNLPFYPVAAAQTNDGITYVVDRNLPGVWKIEGGEATVFFKGSQKYRQPLNAPRCIAIDGDGRVLVGDSAARNIFIVEPEKEPRPISSTRIGIPMAIAVDADQRIHVADLELHQILVLEGFQSEAVPAKKVASVRAPRGLVVDDENQVWVVTGAKNAIQKIAPDGTVTPVLEGADLQYPAGIALLKDGTFAVSDSYQKTVFKMGDNKKLSRLVEGEPLVYPVGLASAGGQLIIADSRGGTVWSVNSDGQVTAVYPSSSK